MTALADATDPRFTDGQRAQLARFEVAEVPAEVVAAQVVFDTVSASGRRNYRVACERCGGHGWTGPIDPRPGVTCDDCNGTGTR